MLAWPALCLVWLEASPHLKLSRLEEPAKYTDRSYHGQRAKHNGGLFGFDNRPLLLEMAKSQANFYRWSHCHWRIFVGGQVSGVRSAGTVCKGGAASQGRVTWL